MKLARTIWIAAATATCAVAAAQPALAGGEAKTSLPFTRATDGRAPTATLDLTSEIARARLMIVAEPENEPPFSTSDALGRFLRTSASPAGDLGLAEPKSQTPFTRRAA